MQSPTLLIELYHRSTTVLCEIITTRTTDYRKAQMRVSYNGPIMRCDSCCSNQVWVWTKQTLGCRRCRLSLRPSRDRQTRKPQRVQVCKPVSSTTDCTVWNHAKLHEIQLRLFRFYQWRLLLWVLAVATWVCLQSLPGLFVCYVRNPDTAASTPIWRSTIGTVQSIVHEYAIVVVYCTRPRKKEKRKTDPHTTCHAAETIIHCSSLELHADY